MNWSPDVTPLIDVVCILQVGIPDEADDFEDYRDRSTELVRDVEFVVGATNVFHQVCCIVMLNLGLFQSRL